MMIVTLRGGGYYTGLSYMGVCCIILPFLACDPYIVCFFFEEIKLSYQTKKDMLY